ncbi:uncharacterized protein HGUI_00070 [Hanseniaspora guilliermondii]|uniref:Uncharacterized protein n=1 Tax=Hanseniaspora guilliermondii TaxID=56406 RepID=A0A1L0FE35_9ASCO|nr:uncharacterized protein HGUI_00070 [Hanseniaspora guilliermondii]
MGVNISNCCSLFFDNSDDSDYGSKESKQHLLKQQKDNYYNQQQKYLLQEEQEKLKQKEREQRLLEKEQRLTDIVNVANESYLDVGIIENIENIMVANEVIKNDSVNIGTNDLETDVKDADIFDTINKEFKNKTKTYGLSTVDNNYSLFLEKNPSILLKDPKITAELFSNTVDIYKNTDSKTRAGLIQIHNTEFKQFQDFINANHDKIKNKIAEQKISFLVQ